MTAYRTRAGSVLVAADRDLLVGALRYALSHAPRCTHGTCRDVAFWYLRDRAKSGFPRDDVLCDRHKREGCREIEDSRVLRAIVDACGFG